MDRALPIWPIMFTRALPAETNENLSFEKNNNITRLKISKNKIRAFCPVWFWSGVNPKEFRSLTSAPFSKKHFLVAVILINLSGKVKLTYSIFIASSMIDIQAKILNQKLDHIQLITIVNCQLYVWSLESFRKNYKKFCWKLFKKIK